MPNQDELGDERFCVGCGYNLRGLAGDRCPECGLRFDAEASSPIPWVHRKHIGFFRSFFKTVMLAMFWPRRLTGAAGVPVDEKAAGRFRWIIVALVSLPAIIWFLAIVYGNGKGVGILDVVPLPSWGQAVNPMFRPWWQFTVIWSAGATLLPVLPIGIVLTCLIGTGIVRQFFGFSSASTARRQRGQAIAAYLCAPLAWLWLPAAAAAAIPAFLQIPSLITLRWLIPPLWLLCAGFVVIPLLYWRNVLQAVAAITDCGWGVQVGVALLLPLAWAAAVICGLGIFPAVVGFLWLMIDSLR